MKNWMRVPSCMLVLVLMTSAAVAQQKIGHVHMQQVLDKMPEYATVQQNVDRQGNEWEDELTERQQEVENMFREYQARELLYTNEERQRRREAIVRAESELEGLRQRYFGPDGEIFDLQQQLLMPIQERVLEAVNEVATREGYDYIIDLSSEVFVVFSRPQYDITEAVLRELGIDDDAEDTGG